MIMTPNEHLTRAECLLGFADDWGPGQSAGYAAMEASAHIALATAKVQRYKDSGIDPTHVWSDK